MAAHSTTVVALAGRRIDAPDQTTPRFPLASVPAVREALRTLYSIRPVVAVVASAACGADLVGLDLAGQLGILRRVILPFSPAKFRATSVIDRPGDWGPLYDSVITAVAAQGELEVLDQNLADEDAYATATQRILDEALELARHVGSSPLAVVVWDGQARSNGTDASMDFIDRAVRAGMPAQFIRTLP